MSLRRPSSDAAFSLVEMLAALMIFSVGVLAVIEVFTACLRSTSASLQYVRAVELAQEVMEENLAEGDLRDRTDGGDFAPAFPRHNWELAIEETETDGLFRVTTVVSWEERGRDRTYRLNTLAAYRE